MNEINMIVGNICSLFATASDTVSSTRKNAKDVLLVQCVSQLFYFVGTMVLKGYSGAVQNAVSLLRNLVAIRNIQNKYLEWFFVGLGVVLGLAINNLGVMGLLPVVANFQYSLAVFRFQDNERALKISFAIAVGLFAIFNIAIFNIVGVVSNSIVCVTTVAVLLKSGKK